MKTQKLLLCCFKPVSLVTFSKCYCWPPGCLGCQLYIYLWEFFFPPLPNLIYLTLQNTNRTGHFSPPLHLLFLHQPCLDLPTGLPASFHPSPRSLSTQCSFQNLGGFASIRNHQRRLKSLGNSLADSKPPLTRGKTDFHKWKKKKNGNYLKGWKSTRGWQHTPPAVIHWEGRPVTLIPGSFKNLCFSPLWRELAQFSGARLCHQQSNCAIKMDTTIRKNKNGLRGPCETSQWMNTLVTKPDSPVQFLSSTE